eukprot:349951-Chlamydomonas_euryale.AAC.6
MHVWVALMAAKSLWTARQRPANWGGWRDLPVPTSQKAAKVHRPRLSPAPALMQMRRGGNSGNAAPGWRNGG